jgi:hypothetical protein
MVGFVGLQSLKLLKIITSNMVNKKKNFRLTKNNLDKIKRFHEISGTLKKEISNTNFIGSEYEFSKIFLALSVLSPQQ